jgi:hypothetical protein
MSRLLLYALVSVFVLLTACSNQSLSNEEVSLIQQQLNQVQEELNTVKINLAQHQNVPLEINLFDTKFVEGHVSHIIDLPNAQSTNFIIEVYLVREDGLSTLMNPIVTEENSEQGKRFMVTVTPKSEEAIKGQILRVYEIDSGRMNQIFIDNPSDI